MMSLRPLAFVLFPFCFVPYGFLPPYSNEVLKRRVWCQVKGPRSFILFPGSVEVLWGLNNRFACIALVFLLCGPLTKGFYSV